MLAFFRQKLEPVAAAYRAGTPRRFSGKTPAEHLRLVVLDAETTGLDVSRDRLLSLATVAVSGDRIHVSTCRAWLIHQPAARINEAVAVHGILPSDTVDGRAEKEVLVELLSLITGAAIVGHHVAFDAAMLDRALRRHFGCGLRNPLIDTARLAMAELEAFKRTGYPGQRPPALEEVCANLGLPMHDRHTASGDVFTTAQVFLLLVARARRRLGRPLRWADLGAERA